MGWGISIDVANGLVHNRQHEGPLLRVDWLVDLSRQCKVGMVVISEGCSLTFEDL